MTFDEWTAEARGSLQEWNPEPATSPGGPRARHDVDVRSSTDRAVASAYVGASTGAGGKHSSTGRRLLSVAAAIVVVAVAGAVVAMNRSSPSTDVASAPPTQSGRGTPGPTTTVAQADPGSGPSNAPLFNCTAADPVSAAPTSAFDRSTAVAGWRAVDTAPQPAMSGPVSYVSGTLVNSAGGDVIALKERAVSFVAAMAPGWSCTVESPSVDVSDPSRPAPIVDGSNTVTNRLGGRCFVPDASATPGSVWGLAPSLAAALDHVDGLTSWNVVLANGGGGGQGLGRLWMEFTFDADPSASDRQPAIRVLADVSAAVNAAGVTAGVRTECTVH